MLYSVRLELIIILFFIYRQICVKLLELLKGSTNDDNIERRKNGVNKVLNAPVHLGALAATLEAQVEQIKSIWVTTRDDAMVTHIKFILIIYV